MYYIYRFRDNEVIITYGTTHSLPKVYKKFFPNIYEPENKVAYYCRKNNRFYGEVKLEYIEYDDIEEAENAYKSFSGLRGWKEFTSKTKEKDELRYLDKLLNRIDYLKSQSLSDEKLHKFLIENFNNTDQSLIYEEKFSKPEGWEDMNKAEKQKYVMQNVEIQKKYELSKGFFINVFQDFSIEELDKDILVKEEIDSKSVPYLVVSIYNTLRYTSHELNTVLKYLNKSQIGIKAEEIPYYTAIKPLMSEYTKAKYVEMTEALARKE